MANIQRLGLFTLLRIALTILFCLMLTWKVSTAALAAQATQIQNPQLMAVFADRKHPETAAKLAGLLFAAKDDAAASEIARVALLDNPLNTRALRVYGLALERQGHRDLATPVMHRAETMGWRDTPALVWGLQNAAIREDASRVIAIADALGRRQILPTITQAVFFAALIDSKLRSPFIRSLARNPSWRPTFFNDLAVHLTMPQTEGMETLLAGLQKTKAPPTPDETLKYISRLADLGDYRRARSFWVHAFGLPVESLAEIPFDSRFARVGRRPQNTPAGPFEWQTDPDLGGEVEFTSDGKGVTLTIASGTPAGATILAQTILLTPGSHEMRTVVTQGAGEFAPVGWEITCLPSNQSLLRSLSDSNDEISRIGFTVPEKGCDAQSLRLIARNQLDAQAVSISAISVQ